MAIVLALALSTASLAEAPFVRNGEASFVVSYTEFALAEDLAVNGACPNGSPKNLVEIHQLTPEGQRRAGESDAGFQSETNSMYTERPLRDARLRSGSANGAAFVLGHTCHGAYQALLANADGHLDPETGANTSISTQYHIKAVPAFVVDRQAVASREGMTQ
jgi:hypothetical protein